MIDVQRRLAAEILKCGKHRVKFDQDMLDEIKEAITKNDVRALISKGAITKKSKLSTSRFWIRKSKKQKSFGKQKGHGSRKGKKTARLQPKRTWINNIRLQRKYIHLLRDKHLITAEVYHEFYLKSKGNYFRSLRHLKGYAHERGIFKNEKR
ncbi:50S ribosomal protein L19e [Candidatus Woesearchaeota archaeon]|nr:50S ribosomal protein L19e [Candidatus Woesearchaeota archaeon]